MEISTFQSLTMQFSINESVDYNSDLVIFYLLRWLIIEYIALC